MSKAINLNSLAPDSNNTCNAKASYKSAVSTHTEHSSSDVEVIETPPDKTVQTHQQQQGVTPPQGVCDISNCYTKI